METEKNNCLNEEMLNMAIRSEDNVPRDQSRINQLILRLKMAFLIFIMALNGKIRSYLKSSGKPHKTIFGRPLHEKDHDAKRIIGDLPRPLEIYDPETKNRFRNPVTEFYLAPTPDSPDEFNQTGPFRLYLRVPPEMLAEGRQGYFYDPDIANVMIQKCRDQFLRETDWFTLLQPHTPYKGIGSTAHFFGVLPSPFASYDNALGSMRPESFLSTDDEDYWSEMKNQHPSLGEASLIERELKGIVNGTNTSFRNIYSSKIEDSQQVFDFKDEHGYPVMKVIKQYDYKATGTTKGYIPVTKWNQSGKPDSIYQLLPLPKKQPLFNLDKIVHADMIVFCPDLEIADALQSLNQDDKVAYTAVLCDVNSQVDISPVKEKSLCLLAINHSGLTLAEAYIETQKHYDFFAKNKIGSDIEVIQAEVSYPAAPRDFNSIALFMEYHRNHQKPYIKPGSLIVMDTEEQFREMVNSAKAEMERKANESQDKSFWAPEQVKVEVVEEEKSKPANRELIRTIAARGCITYISGATHIGKSNFIAALCAYAVNISQRKPDFLSERCWTVCKTGSKYKRLKIVHGDLENGQGGINQREMDFVDPYMPDDPEERKACKANYIVKDLLSDPIDYSAESHFQDLCKMINDCAANEGEKGQPVDILVIDTYWSFVHENDTKFDVFRKLLALYPDMAIIVLHHLNANGKSYGRLDKDFGASVVLYMERINSTEIKDLHEPFQIRVGTKNRLTHLAVDLEPFSAQLDDKGHFVVFEPKTTKAETIKALKEGYKTRNKDGKLAAISDQELADRLGMGVEKLKKYLNEKQGGNEK